jgi:organic hydroperoxide reductase OsmC/OhrA
MTFYPYVTRLHWAGSTGAGVRSYSRDHVAVAPPARLAVTVQVAAGTDEALVRELAEQAHRSCYVANSLSVPVEVTTAVTFG